MTKQQCLFLPIAYIYVHNLYLHNTYIMYLIFLHETYYRIKSLENNVVGLLYGKFKEYIN